LIITLKGLSLYILIKLVEVNMIHKQNKHQIPLEELKTPCPDDMRGIYMAQDLKGGTSKKWLCN